MANRTGIAATCSFAVVKCAAKSSWRATAARNRTSRIPALQAAFLAMLNANEALL